MSRIHPGLISAVACLTLSLAPRATAAGDEAGAVRSWTAPPYWTSPGGAAPESQGREALASGRQPLTPGPVVMPFVAVAPCRVADTRGFGFTGAYGPPSLAASETRTYTIAGQCNIPADAEAVSFNFTVWNTASYGNLTVYPAGASVPTVSTLNWPPGTLALANAAIVPLGSGGSAGQISVANQSTSAIDVFIDVNGYYSPLGVVNTVNGLSGNVSLPSLPPSGAAGGALAGSYPNPTLGSGQAVTTLNSLTDAVTLLGGAGITITPAGNNITIAGPSSLPPSGAAGGALAGTFPNPTLASGQAVKTLNSLTDAVTLTGGTSITITPVGNNLTIAGPSTLPPSGAAGGALAGTYPNPTIGTGQAVKTLNGKTDAVTLAAGNNITITPSGNTLTIASPAATTAQHFATYSMPAGNFVGVVYLCAAGTLVTGYCGYAAFDVGGFDVRVAYSGPDTGNGNYWRCQAVNSGSVARTLTYGATCSTAMTAVVSPLPTESQARASGSAEGSSGLVIDSIQVIDLNK